MKSIRELKQEKVTLFNQAKAIKDQADKETRSMSQEEQNNWNAVMDKWTALKTDIDQRQRLEEMESEVNSAESRSVNRPDSSEGQEQGEQRGMFDLSNVPARYQAALRELHERGDFRMKPDYQGVMPAFFRNGTLPRVNQRDLQSDDGPKGGYITPPPQFVVGLLKAIDADLFLRQSGWATVITLNSTEGYEASLDSDPDDFEWRTEIQDLNYDDGLTFGKRELKPTRLAKGIKISNQLLRLAPAAENIAIERMQYKAGGTMEKAYFTGTGAKQPLGFYTASDMGIPTSRDVSTGNNATSLTFAGLRAAKYGMKSKYWRESKWLFHQDAIKQLAALEDDLGYPMLSEGVAVGEPDTLSGIPYYMSEFNPNTFTTGQYVGILGAFRYYHIADSLTMTIQRVVELYSRSAQTGFHFELYTDGMPVLAEAFTRVKLA
jgi:HK97 family phage major capsid protein